MTISKEQIEAALKHIRQFAFEQHNGCEYYIPFLDVETVITVLQERLSTYKQLNENDSQLNTSSEALAALDRLHSFAKSTNDNIQFHHIDEIDCLVNKIRAALQRNDVPQGFVLVPIDVTPQMQKAYFDKVDEVIEFFGRYQTQRLAYASMLSAAPKPTGE